MKNLPTPIKVILNIIFFIIYRLLSCFIIWLLIWLASPIFWIDVDLLPDSLFEKIASITFFLTFITIFFRKVFYISIKNISDEEKEVIEIEYK